MSIKQVLKTQDEKVIKYIHDDNSETAIKSVVGCGNNSRDKYSIFLSCSYGCQARCKFCMLSTKGIQYNKLNYLDVLCNAKESLEDFVSRDPKIKEKALKLSWMGMGEPLYHMDLINNCSPILIEWIINKSIATSIDRIDLSTTLPGKVDVLKIIELVSNLNKSLQGKIASYNSSQPAVKIFLSIISAVPETRIFLIGKSKNLPARCKILRNYLHPNNLAVHHLLLKDINDSDEEVSTMISFMKERLPNVELRLLRYNQCSGSPFLESPKFDEVADVFKQELPVVKIQESPGSEIMAACGQFLLTSWKGE